MKAVCLLFVIVAVVVGVLACVLPADRLNDLHLYGQFFREGVWVLAFGALVKYLLTNKSTDPS